MFDCILLLQANKSLELLIRCLGNKNKSFGLFTLGPRQSPLAPDQRPAAATIDDSADSICRVTGRSNRHKNNQQPGQRPQQLKAYQSHRPKLNNRRREIPRASTNSTDASNEHQQRKSTTTDSTINSHAQRAARLAEIESQCSAWKQMRRIGAGLSAKSKLRATRNSP